MLTRTSPRQGGFTLIESMIALGVSAIMASLAYPSFADQVRKAHRTDAIVRLSMLQLAQERWRSGNPSYASLAQTGIAAQTADGLYQLSVSDNQASGYVAVAAAQGGQLRDAACRFLRLTVEGGNAARASGPDANVTNTPAANSRCWNR